MARVPAILQSDFPYNISARCINKEWFNLPMREVWDIFCDVLTETSQVNSLKIHSFVLMSNHFHLIASTPEANISECMHRLMFKTSKRLTKAGNRINQTFAGRHYKCVLQRNNYYLNAYKYNYLNPVSAGICQNVEDYTYSSLNLLLNNNFKKIPLVEDFTFNSDPNETLKWLNQKPDKYKLEALRAGMKHQFFKSRICKILKTEVIGPDEII